MNVFRKVFDRKPKPDALNSVKPAATQTAPPTPTPSTPRPNTGDSPPLSPIKSIRPSFGSLGRSTAPSNSTPTSATPVDSATHSAQLSTPDPSQVTSPTPSDPPLSPTSPTSTTSPSGVVDTSDVMWGGIPSPQFEVDGGAGNGNAVSPAVAAAAEPGPEITASVTSSV
ncbi:hypothetical protein HDU93_002815, partial [Gonapodya sp. JEL0774]